MEKNIKIKEKIFKSIITEEKKNIFYVLKMKTIVINIMALHVCFYVTDVFNKMSVLAVWAHLWF